MTHSTSSTLMSAHTPAEKMLIGRLEGKLQLVKHMLESGLEIKVISELTDLSIEQVQCVQQSVLQNTIIKDPVF